MHDNKWAFLNEDNHIIKIETDKLEAVIPKKNPKHWMTGIEKGGHFLTRQLAFAKSAMA